MVEQFENRYSTILNGAIDDNDTTIVVDTAPVTMTANFRIKIEDELILVGTVSGTSFLTCTRGIEGTTAVSHADNVLVTHVLTAEGLNQKVNDATFVGAAYASNAAQSFTSTTSLVIVDFEDAIISSANVTTGASWSYAAPSTGVYLVDSRIVFAGSTAWSAAAERGVLQLYKNTAFYRTLDRRDGYITAGASMIMTLGGSTLVSLNTGETIDVRASQNSGSTIALDGTAGNNYIDITKIGV